jgi:hypothetical protein
MYEAISDFREESQMTDDDEGVFEEALEGGYGSASE